MKKILLIVAAAAFASSAHAVKLGFNLDYASGDSEFDNFGDEFDVSETGIGFSLATGHSKQAFSYRLHANLFKGDADDSNETSGFNVTNTFGFVLNQTRAASSPAVWLGPSINIAVFDVENDFGDESEAVAFGIGPTLGLDFVSAAGNTTFTAEVGYRFQEGNLDADGLFSDDQDFQTSQFLVRGVVLFGQ